MTTPGVTVVPPAVTVAVRVTRLPAGIDVLVLPEVMVSEVVVAACVATEPVPVNDTVCGDAVALSFTVSVPVRVPLAVGLKVTEILQLDPAVTLPPQVFVSPKSPATAMDITLRVECPELFSVTVCAALVVPIACEAKLKLAGASAAVAGVIPVPVNETACGDPAALSVTDSVPVREPLAVGLKVTEIPQFAPAASVAPQLVVAAKSPEAAIDETASADDPLFVSVTVCAALVVPVVCEAKLRLVGDSVTAGPDAFPVSVTT
jgi:hypothetical protein